MDTLWETKSLQKKKKRQKNATKITPLMSSLFTVVSKVFFYGMK